MILVLLWQGEERRPRALRPLQPHSLGTTCHLRVTQSLQVRGARAQSGPEVWVQRVRGTPTHEFFSQTLTHKPEG